MTKKPVKFKGVHDREKDSDPLHDRPIHPSRHTKPKVSVTKQKYGCKSQVGAQSYVGLTD